MTRENTKELMPIIQAYAEGKTIQYRTEDGWKDFDKPSFSELPTKYRIKSEQQS